MGHQDTHGEDVNSIWKATCGVFLRDGQDSCGQMGQRELVKIIHNRRYPAVTGTRSQTDHV